MTPSHAFDFLESNVPDAPIAALFGNVPLLRSLAKKHLLAAWANDADVDYCDGDKKSGVSWRDVRDELATRSLFGGGKRIVWVRDADDFVSANRPELEKYAASPLPSGTLILELGAFAANTKLYKAFVAKGLVVDCRVPQLKRGRGNPTPDSKRVAEWLCVRAEQAYQCKLKLTGAQAMIELVGLEFGLLDQELARISLFAEPGDSLTAKEVRKLCGGWRSQTTWDLIDAMLDGDTADAIRQLDQLLQSGSVPVALLAQISWSLRRLATAARLILIARRHKEQLPLPEALKKAGFQPFLRKTAEKQLKHLGPDRATQLLDWLMATDLALKGSHSSPTRGRQALEELIIKIAQPRSSSRS